MKMSSKLRAESPPWRSCSTIGYKLINPGTEKEIRLLAKGLKETRGELGGLSRTVSYGFENDAYRMLPAFLKKNYGIAIKEKLKRY